MSYISADAQVQQILAPETKQQPIPIEGLCHAPRYSLCGLGECWKRLQLPQVLFFITVSVFKMGPAARGRDDFMAA